MSRTLIAATILIAAMSPLNATSAFAASQDSKAVLCAEAPTKAAEAGIDCTTTSSVPTDKDDDGRKYPSGPTSFGNGIVL